MADTQLARNFRLKVTEGAYFSAFDTIGGGSIPGPRHYQDFSSG